MSALKSLKVLEFAAIGPGPFAGMMLADWGADVVLIDRSEQAGGIPGIVREKEILHRNKRSIALNLKNQQDVDLALQLITKADVLIEGYRPMVMEKMGLGPDVCLKQNPRLVYARMTGYGQTGSFSQYAGHDANYLALCGSLMLGAIDQHPNCPPTLLGDLSAGSLTLLLGIMMALYERERSGLGQVVDGAIVDGLANLSNLILMFKALGQWDWQHAGNSLLDGGAPFYRQYCCADGLWLSVGALEPKFFANLMHLLELDQSYPLEKQYDQASWPKLSALLTASFVAQPRAIWLAKLLDAQCCVTPVLTLKEATEHTVHLERQNFVKKFGLHQANSAPKMSRNQAMIKNPPPQIGQHQEEVLLAWLRDNLKSKAK